MAYAPGRLDALASVGEALTAEGSSNVLVAEDVSPARPRVNLASEHHEAGGTNTGGGTQYAISLHLAMRLRGGTRLLSRVPSIGRRTSTLSFRGGTRWLLGLRSLVRVSAVTG